MVRRIKVTKIKNGKNTFLDTKKVKCSICGATMPGINYPKMTNYCSKECMDKDE